MEGRRREGIKESRITKQKEQKHMVMPLNLPQKLKGFTCWKQRGVVDSNIS